MSPPESTSPHKEDDFIREFSDKLKLLAHEFRKLINGMPDSHDEIEKIAKHLIETGNFVTVLSKENGHEPADVVHHILNQPLTIPGTDHPISLLEAAKLFQKEEAYESELFKLLSTFHEYPGPTGTLVAELDILIQELDRHV